MLSILGGLAIMAVGILITIKSEAIYNFVGPIAFFEKYLGAEGGSRLGYKLLGVLGFFIGLMMFTGMSKGLINWILGPLIRAGQF